MRVLCGMLSLVLAASAPAADEPQTLHEMMIKKAIDAYEQQPRPPRNELRDLVIVIDPVGGGSPDPKQRQVDDLAVMTAGHLFHLVIGAGGVPKLTRADDRLPPYTGGDAAAGPAQACDKAKCHLFVRIDFATVAFPDRQPGAAAMNDDGLSIEFAGALAEATGVAAGGPVASGGIVGPGATVTFPGPTAKLHPYERLGYPRKCAEALYRGIAAFVAPARGKLDEERIERWPGLAPKAKADPIPLYPDRTPPEKLVQAAKRIWPHGTLPIDKAAWFADMFRRAALSDHAIVYFEPQITIEGDTVIVGGATNAAYIQRSLAAALRSLGLKNVRNKMRVLPEQGHLGDKPFGACVAPMALTFSEPSDSAGVQTQLLYGDPLFLLDCDAGYCLVHGVDGYWGWVREEGVHRMTADEFERYTAPDTAALLVDLNSGDRRVLRGSRLPIVSSADGKLTLMRPDGATMEIAAKDARVVDHREAANERVGAALSILHTPYVFGGKSPIGLDCSGLVCNVMEQAGDTPARDAAQQLLAGRLVATRWHQDTLRPGDLLFFIDTSGKIFHVAVAITPTHFVHCSPPEVQISSLRKGDGLYYEHYATTFLFAKRP